MQKVPKKSALKGVRDPFMSFLIEVLIYEKVKIPHKDSSVGLY